MKTEFTPDKTQAFYEDVYYIKPNTHQPDLEPVAIRPRVFEGRISWEDNSMRGRSVSLAYSQVSFEKDSQEATPKKIKIITNDQQKIVLVKLTLQIYNDSIRKYVAGKPAFTSDEELKEYYLKTNFQLY